MVVAAGSCAAVDVGRPRAGQPGVPGPLHDALVGGLDHLDDAERNGIWLLFTRPAMRTLLADWTGEAQQLIGQFRAANGARTDHPRVRALIDGLQQASPDFTRMWAEHPIREFAPARKHFHHPAAGPLTLDYIKLAALEDPDQHLLTFMPAEPGTAARLPELLTHEARTRQARPLPAHPDLRLWRVSGLANQRE